MSEKKPTARRGAAETKKKRIDWDAVERDYRAGNLTLRELATKHGGTHQAIGQRAKKHGWTQDLSKAVRAATNAKVIAETVANEVAKTGQEVANVVLAAAELNKQVILGHRKHAVDARAAMDAARAKLLALGDAVADIREAATFASAVESLSRTAKNVIDIERTAFGLNDSDGAKQDEPRIDWAATHESERMGAYLRMVNGG